MTATAAIQRWPPNPMEIDGLDDISGRAGRSGPRPAKRAKRSQTSRRSGTDIRSGEEQLQSWQTQA